MGNRLEGGYNEINRVLLSHKIKRVHSIVKHDGRRHLGRTRLERNEIAHASGGPTSPGRHDHASVPRLVETPRSLPHAAFSTTTPQPQVLQYIFKC